MFEQITVVGIGLIGSSIARAVRARGLARKICAFDAHAEHCAVAQAEHLVDAASVNAADVIPHSDLVILCVPVGQMAAAAAAIAPYLAPGAILSDTGSVKGAVIAAVQPHVPAGVVFIPAHPIAGTENSGPRAGFAELFRGRYCLLTPLPGTPPAAIARLRALWEGCGSTVEDMDPAHHDRVLAITSHLPHLIAYTIVGTASDLEGHLQSEVIRYSAGGFRDFTRLAASDPTMWRDVFLHNKEAVLEVAQRFSEDLTALQRAIRWGDGEKLFDLFTRTRAIRRSIVKEKQA